MSESVLNLASKVDWEMGRRDFRYFFEDVCSVNEKYETLSVKIGLDHSLLPLHIVITSSTMSPFRKVENSLYCYSKKFFLFD